MNNVGSKVRFVESEDVFGKVIYGKFTETDDGKYEGAIGYCPTYCQITHIFVNKAFRNQGIGTLLFKKAVSKMPHCSEITVRAYRSREYSSVGFYQNQGMEISENDPLEHYHDPDDKDTVHMFLKN